MNIIFTAIVIVFVLSTIAVVGFALFEISPLARHADRYRDPLSGRRRWESPRLD
jgi:hypothetical protein